MKITIKNTLTAILRCLFSVKRPSKQANERGLLERGESLNDFIMREATQADIPALATLLAQTWAETYWNVRRPPTTATRECQWGELFKTKNDMWCCLVIENKKGELVGFAKGQTYAHQDLPAYSGELNKIYLLKAYQRLGLGRKLIRAVAKRLLNMGISNMVLFGIPQNPSCHFHEAMGGERLYVKNGEFHGGHGWMDLKKLVLTVLMVMLAVGGFSQSLTPEHKDSVICGIKKQLKANFVNTAKARLIADSLDSFQEQPRKKHL